MKLSSPFFDHVIELRENRFCSLIMENQKCCRVFLKDIISLANNGIGRTVLSENDTPIAFAKNAEVIDRIIPFDINRRSLISGITGIMEKKAADETHFLRTQELLADIENYADELSFTLPCRLEYTKLSIASLIKSIGVAISCDSESTLDSILDYMELSREFGNKKLFIFVGFRNFFDDTETLLFTKTALLHKHSLLMLESSERKKLENEDRTIVDSDLCVI